MTEFGTLCRIICENFYSLIVADHVPGLSGSSEKHDLPMRTRHLPNVRRPDVGVSNMSQGSRQTYSALLKIKDCHRSCIARWIFLRAIIWRTNYNPRRSTTFREGKRLLLHPVYFWQQSYARLQSNVILIMILSIV